MKDLTLNVIVGLLVMGAFAALVVPITLLLESNSMLIGGVAMVLGTVTCAALLGCAVRDPY